MDQKLKLTIPVPCHQSWEEMTENKIGRHCMSCEKTVVDFTKMNTDEIKGYFLNHAKEKTCGYFKVSQIEIPPKKYEHFLITNYQKAQNGTSFMHRIGVFAFGSLLFLSGCSQSKKDQHTVGEMKSRTEISKDTVVSVTATQDTLVEATKKGEVRCPPTKHSVPTALQGESRDVDPIEDNYDGRMLGMVIDSYIPEEVPVAPPVPVHDTLNMIKGKIKRNF
jgi:hypothetical protein